MAGEIKTAEQVEEWLANMKSLIRRARAFHDQGAHDLVANQLSGLWREILIMYPEELDEPQAAAQGKEGEPSAT